jgi:hypothetical protein
VDDRDVLLNHLRLLNQALERSGAIPDLTFAEAEDMLSLDALRMAIEGSEYRLAAIIAMGG